MAGSSFGLLWVVVASCGWFWLVAGGCWMVLAGCGWLLDGFGWLWVVACFITNALEAIF